MTRVKRTYLPALHSRVYFGHIHLFRLPDRRRRARKARRWCGLGDAVAGDERFARGHVRMLGGFLHGQDRREADVGAFHDLAPFVAALGLEHLDQFFFQRRPGVAIEMRVEAGFRQARALAQQRVELRFDRADRDELAAGAFIDAVKMRAAVEEIGLALIGPASRRRHVEEHRHQRRRAVAHRGVDHLALAGFLRFQQRGEHADHEIERAAAEIADQIERRHRLFLGADRGERTGHRDIIDVMAGGLRQRAFLAPSGHAAVNQARIARQHHVWPETEPLHHAGTKAFDQRVGIGQEIQHLRDRRLVLEVEFDHLPPTPGHRFQIFLGADAIERHHFRAHVGQHHAGKRTGADAGEFDDAKTCQRAGGAGGGLRG